MTRALARRALSLGALLSSLSACGLVGEPVGPLVQNTCTTTDDCARGVCEPDMGICISGEAASYLYYVDIVPPPDPAGHQQLAVRTGPFATTVDVSTLELFVPRQVRVQGTLRRQGVGARGAPVSGQVTFVRRSDGDAIAARTSTVQVRTLSIEPGVDPSTREFDWAVELLPRSTYDIFVEPQDSDRALLYPRLIGELVLADEGVQVELTYDDPASILEYAFRGRLVDADGTPHEGLEVRCVDPETGAVVSSVGTSGEDGTFTVFRNPAASSWQLRITAPALVQEAGAFPRYTVDPSVLLPGEVVDILIPAAPSTFEMRGRVEFRPAESTELRPVPNATIYLRSAVVIDERTGLAGSYDLTINSDDAGNYVAQLPAGEYSVQVVPSDSTLGILVLQQTVRGDLLGHVLEVPVRTRTGGAVVAPDGEPMADARVRATSLGLAPPGSMDASLARLARGSEVTTDAMGQFAIGVDIGVYDIRVEPATGSGWPWAVSVGLPVGNSAAIFAYGNVTVSAPTVVSGTAAYRDGAYLTGAEIRAYGVTGPDGAQRLVQVGSATVDADGDFRLLLPPNIAVAR